MDTAATTLHLALLILIMAMIPTPVSGDVCTTDGLQEGKGAAVSNTDTLGCTNSFCNSGSPGYHIILIGNQVSQRQEVEVNVKKGCDSAHVIYDHTVLVLMSGFPVKWILTGFSPGIVFIVGGGRISNKESDEFELFEIPAISYNILLRVTRQNIQGQQVKALIDELQKKTFETLGEDNGWPFNHQVASSVNYAWEATSWTLTVGEACCLTTSTKPTQAVTTYSQPKPTLRMTSHRPRPSYSPSTIRWNPWTNTATIPNLHPTQFPRFTTEAPIMTSSNSFPETGLSGPASGIAGIAAGAGTIVLIIIITITITAVCCSCHRKTKHSSPTSPSQTTQLHTVQGLQTIESGTTPQPSVGVNYLGVVSPQQAAPNAYVQSGPIPPSYPTGGPPPPAGPVAYPEQPPAYDDVHPMKPPSYSQVRREVDGRVEPSAPPIPL